MLLMAVVSFSQSDSKRIRSSVDQEEIERQAELERQDRLRREGFIDLGLSSGTYWMDSNEGGDTTYYDSAETSRLLKDRCQVDGRWYPELPDKGQFMELKEECTWTWTGNGYTVVGPNGNSIFLPAAGFRNCDGNVGNVGIGGYYQLGGSYGIYFTSENVDVYSFYGCRGRTVRLVLDISGRSKFKRNVEFLKKEMRRRE
jgi:hypothetical protein